MGSRYIKYMKMLSKLQYQNHIDLITFSSYNVKHYDDNNMMQLENYLRG